MNDALLDALRRAVQASPDDLALRLHLGDLLVDAGLGDEAVANAAEALRLSPGNTDARALMNRALAPSPGEPPLAPSQLAPPAASDAPTYSDAPTHSSPPPIDAPPPTPASADFNWSAAEEQVGDLAGPMFVASDPGTPAFDVERSTLTLADVGGMESVKERLNAAFLAPLKNPELRAL